MNMINFKGCEEIPDVCSFKHCSAPSDMKDCSQWLVPALHPFFPYSDLIEMLSLRNGMLAYGEHLFNDTNIFKLVNFVWISNIVPTDNWLKRK